MVEAKRPDAPDTPDRPEMTFLTSKLVPFANFEQTKNLDQSILLANEIYVLLVACKDYSKIQKENPAWKDIELAYENCDKMKEYVQKRY